MDKKQAIELLKQALTEIPKLKAMHYGNQEFKLWCARVETIIKEGLNADDYNRLDSVKSKYFPDELEIDHLSLEEDYLPKLNDYEIVLKSIIQKYEMLGIAEEVDKGGEVEKMDRIIAIGVLKQESNEAVYLASLLYKNKVFLPWRRKIENILELAFGDTSTEYKRVANIHMKTRGNREANQKTYIELVHRIQHEVDSIVNKYEMLEIMEEMAPQTDNIRTGFLLTIFESLQLHQKVIEASRELFKDGHYRDAIYRAFVEVNNYTKEKSNIQLDGKRLMSTVFNLDNPIIKLNSLKTQSDKDEQEGFMFLFMGAMEGIRNPKAHENIIQNDPYRTLEYLGLASLLMRIAEEGKVSKKSTRKPKLDEETFIARCTEGNHQNSILLYSKIKDLLSLRRNNGDFINWGVSGYSYNIAWKDNPAGETIFTGSTGGGLSLWLYIIEKSGEAGQKYLQNLRKIADFGSKVDDYRKHKEPGFSTDEMTEADIDAFISTIKELGLALEAESSKLDSGSDK